MGNITKSDNIVLFFDTYSADSQNLHTSFQQAGKNYPVVVIEDDGFLPDGVMSVMGYFLGEYPAGKNIPGKPRYFNQITVPKFWEISGNNSLGKVHNLNKERARIFYAEPKHKRLIKVVDWYDDRGVVRSSDHYNNKGALYARTIFNHQGKKVNKSYFDANGREIIMENYVTKDIILNDGDQVRIFPNKKEFIKFFLEKSGYAQWRLFYNTLSTSFLVSEMLQDNGKGDVLFWQEGVREDVPGNMRLILDGRSARTAKIMVQNKKSYDKFMELGLSPEIVHKLGYIYPFSKENEGKPEILICTNSDRIAQLEKLVEALPEMHFSIAAITEMSSKLMSFDRYSNVSLYPGIKMKLVDELFMNSDFYLDINHEGEILTAVRMAFLHNHIIYAFREVMHNGAYTCEERVYGMDEADRMIQDIREAVKSKEVREEQLKKQHEWAMLENVETYSVL